MHTGISKSYRHLRISEPVIVRRTEMPKSVDRRIVLILGPTGAGKSTLIEALADDSVLGISSNRLEGFTQSVSAYELQGVSRMGDLIYLVDVPGFADTKISVLSIVSMLGEWMKENDVTYFSQLLYLTPINVVRLPGSQREVLKTFRSLTGIKTSDMTLIVSTMWDTIWSDSARERAERNFDQLKDDIWKENLKAGSRIVRFMNTQESALDVLDAAFDDSSIAYLHVEDFFRESGSISYTPFGSHVYDDLQTRICALKLQRYNIQSEVQLALGSSDKELLSTLGLQLDEADKLLAKFEGELLTYFGQLSETMPIVPDLVPSQVPVPAHADQPTPAEAPKNLKQGLFTQVLHTMKRWRSKDR